jgi:hypothetical protein
VAGRRSDACGKPCAVRADRRHDLGRPAGLIPVIAAGIINGIGHYWGYRNSRARTPVEHRSRGIIIGGEELHNN